MDFENLAQERDCFNGKMCVFSCLGSTRKDAGGAVIEGYFFFCRISLCILIMDTMLLQQS